ncbi:signal peptidase I [Nocardioides malaquae]|uniref:signal peptidase I n=1 Tax=Nocardioides malaquae TaxID=2773426 RepID=UPI0029D41318|nr:signal peptidase I [Nocardioides malaquae]
MSRLSSVIRRIVGVSTTLLLLAVTVGSAAYVVAGFLGYERYVITGGSMSGTFEKGSVAFEKHVPVADLQVGDVITYLPPPDSGLQTLVTHRITKIETSSTGAPLFTTQGDANPDPDPWAFSLVADTQPVVTTTVPHVGHLFIALADPRNRVIAIGVPAAVIALLALRDLVQAVRPASRAPQTQRPLPPPVGGRWPDRPQTV